MTSRTQNMVETIEFSRLEGFRKFAFIMEIVFLVFGLIGAVGILTKWLFLVR